MQVALVLTDSGAGSCHRPAVQTVRFRYWRSPSAPRSALPSHLPRVPPLCAQKNVVQPIFASCLIRLLISPAHAVYGEEEYKHERQSASIIVGSAVAIAQSAAHCQPSGNEKSSEALTPDSGKSFCVEPHSCPLAIANQRALDQTAITREQLQNFLLG